MTTQSLCKSLCHDVFRRTITSTRTSKFPSTRKSSTLPGRTSAFPDSTRRTYNVLNQKVTYTLKEFLAEYEGRANEASARMEKSINDKIASLNDKIESHSSSVNDKIASLNDKIESHSSSVNDKIESRISNAENKMLYLFVGAIIIDWTKVIIEKFYDKEQKNNESQEKK